MWISEGWLGGGRARTGLQGERRLDWTESIGRWIRLEATKDWTGLVLAQDWPRKDVVPLM